MLKWVQALKHKPEHQTADDLAMFTCRISNTALTPDAQVRIQRVLSARSTWPPYAVNSAALHHSKASTRRVQAMPLLVRRLTLRPISLQ